MIDYLIKLCLFSVKDARRGAGDARVEVQGLDAEDKQVGEDGAHEQTS